MLSESVTEWLSRWNAGDEAALDRIAPLVYEELHRLAARFLKGERPGHTLQATALVHEAYLQVRGMDGMEWRNRAHFIAVAARTMRRILVAHARQHRAAKRGGGAGNRINADPDAFGVMPNLDVLALDEALEKLALRYPRQAQVVELRYFGGLTAEETAEVLGSSTGGSSLRTVERDWRFARAWLQQAMETGNTPGQ